MVIHICDKGHGIQNERKFIKTHHQAQRINSLVREDDVMDFDIPSKNSLFRKYCEHPPEFSQSATADDGRNGPQ